MTDDDDASLIALIDGKLEGSARDALTARLETNSWLRARLEQLAGGKMPFRAAFAAVLDEAPVARMQAGLDAIADAGPTSVRPRPFWAGAVAAALAMLVVGWAIGRYVPVAPGLHLPTVVSDQDDWRQAVADYVALYNADTLATVPTGGEEALPFLSDRLGVKLSSASVALPGMTFKRAQMLSYNGTPLGQVAYVDEADRPVAFCVIRNGQGDAPITAERRDGLTLASWARGGRGYVVIGRFSRERAKQLAETLIARF
jgi:anti-sigma factor RsiW